MPCGYGSRIALRLSGTTAEFADSVFKQPAVFPRRDFRPSCAISLSLSLTEGAGKAGRRLRPQHRVQWVDKNAHGFDRYSRDIPAFPAQWLYGLYVLSPVSGLYCHRCRARTGRPDRRQGRGARTTRFRRTRRSFVGRRTSTPFGMKPFRLRLPRPSHPCPTCRDDHDTSLMRARTAKLIPQIRIPVKRNIFL
jgi:hypothetical protein